MKVMCKYCGDNYDDFDVAHVCSSGQFAPSLKTECENSNDLYYILEYSKELDLTFPLTVKHLVESHRSLREQFLKRNEEYQNELKRGYKEGYKQGLSIASELEYISRERLKNMTMAELVELLYE